MRRLLLESRRAALHQDFSLARKVRGGAAAAVGSSCGARSVGTLRDGTGGQGRDTTITTTTGGVVGRRCPVGRGLPDRLLLELVRLAREVDLGFRAGQEVVEVPGRQGGRLERGHGRGLGREARGWKTDGCCV